MRRKRCAAPSRDFVWTLRLPPLQSYPPRWLTLDRWSVSGGAWLLGTMSFLEMPTFRRGWQIATFLVAGEGSKLGVSSAGDAELEAS